MKILFNIIMITTISFAQGLSPKAQENVDFLFKKYESQGGKNFNSARAKIEWSKEHKVTNKKGKTEIMSCKKCHTDDLTKASKHYKTGKDIRPLSPLTNKDAFVKLKHTKKWFKRNCKQVYKRVCSPQEKGDFLKFMIGE